MKDWPHKLFSEGDLTDFLIDRWERFGATIALPGVELDKRKLEEHLLRTPRLVCDFKIVKHGFKPQDPSVPGADFVESGLLRVAHPRSFIILQIPFCGDVDLFRYRPPDYAGVAPQGLVCQQCLRLRYERSGSDDSDWQGLLRNDYLAIHSLLDQAAVWVQGFNGRLSNMLASSSMTVSVTPPPIKLPPCNSNFEDLLHQSACGEIRREFH